MHIHHTIVLATLAFLASIPSSSGLAPDVNQALGARSEVNGTAVAKHGSPEEVLLTPPQKLTATHMSVAAFLTNCFLKRIVSVTNLVVR